MEGRLLEGKYRVSHLIGEGGMGSVYEAEHTLIGRPVAVKVLHGDFAKSREALERFRREARAATAIRHPNIIEITDMGTTAEGQPFLVMELLEGSPLSSLIGEGRTLPTARIVDIFSQVLDALDAAHKKGIVHRDLKPDNVFTVQDYSRPDFVKLLDFGISKMTGATAGGGLSMTRTGSVMGTPNYMAPEQAMGKKDCDHRVDLWAVGVMLYEALTGRLPYLGENYNELLTAILMTTPPTPRSVTPSISPAIERVILRALAKEREERYQTASELRDDLRAAAGAKDAARPLAVLAPAVPVPLRAPVETPSPTPNAAPVSPSLIRTTSKPARPSSPATLTPGGYDAPTLEPPVARKQPWLLYAGAGAVALVGIGVAIALLSSKGSPAPAADDAAAPGAPPAAESVAGDAASGPATALSAEDAGAPRERDDAATAAMDDAGATAVDDAAARPPASDASPDAGPADAVPPDAAVPDAAPETVRTPDAGVPRDTTIDSTSPADAARPPSDRGRPGRDAGGRVRDTVRPPVDDGGRPPMRRDYS